MYPPTREEINVFDSPDEQYAVSVFLGKNLDGAEAIFRKNGFKYSECLMWMGPAAFRYYVMAAIRYLTSNESHGDHGMVSGFHLALSHRSEFEGGQLVPIANSLAAACDYLIENESKFLIARKDDFFVGLTGIRILTSLATLRDQFRAMAP